MRRVNGLVTTFLMVLLPGIAAAQVDLSGHWTQIVHEDAPERGAGPDIGEYYGLPLTDEARSRAESWDAEKQYSIEHVCDPHPADYAPSGPGHLRVRSEIDPLTEEVVAWHLTLNWMTPQRHIWMDGRAHPSNVAVHTWQGFSTGHWQGDTLVITTTHLKESYARRNGVARSDLATLTEFLTRHGNYLTLVSAIDDPVYLTEPLVRSREWVYNPGYRMTPYTCIPRLQVARPRGFVAHYLPGDNPLLEDFARKYQIPLEAARGGARTMYPEFMLELPRLPLPPSNPR